MTIDGNVRIASSAAGQAAYERYSYFLNHRTHDGKTMPVWYTLPLRVQEAWCAAALAGYAVIEAADRSGGGLTPSGQHVRVHDRGQDRADVVLLTGVLIVLIGAASAIVWFATR